MMPYRACTATDVARTPITLTSNSGPSAPAGVCVSTRYAAESLWSCPCAILGRTIAMHTARPARRRRRDMKFPAERSHPRTGADGRRKAPQDARPVGTGEALSVAPAGDLRFDRPNVKAMSKTDCPAYLGCGHSDTVVCSRSRAALPTVAEPCNASSHSAVSNCRFIASQTQCTLASARSDDAHESPVERVNAPAKTCPQCGQTYDFEQRFCPRDGSTLRAPAGSNLVGSVLADRYHIVRRIGEGGMGQVYLAEHVKMRRRSAVKVLHQGMVNDPDAIARFNREASNASQIQHPNVAAIYDFGETDDGLIYLAMEFIDGEPLRKVIERQGALPAAQAADITRQVADALDAAHEMGIIHRDLKPDNIMIARGRSGEDVAKVVDFGIAKATSGDDQKVTRTGLAIGTPEYMSPEQLSGDALDNRTDIYSLGLVAFNMLTGQLPFPAVSSREAMIARLTERPRTLAEIKDDVAWPPELQTVMDRALASQPQ